MDVEKISLLIKFKRKEKGFTQEELARRIGVTEKAISRWETGRGTPDISLLIPLSNELGISVSELLNGKENNLNDSLETIIKYEENCKIIRNKFPLIISIIIYIFVLFTYLLYLKSCYNINNHFSYLFHLLVNGIFCTLISISNWNLYSNYFDKVVDKELMNKITYGIILILYLIMILNLTIFLRPMKLINIENFNNLFKYGGFNIIPFKTIINYIINYKKFSFYFLCVNIIGNIAVFMPLQYFLMKVLGRLNYKKYLIIDVLMIIIIEFIQLITNCGVFDVDDIFLNVFGMSIVYFIVSMKLELKMR